jgi:hypothetical protein
MNSFKAYMRIDAEDKLHNPFFERIRIIYPDGTAEWGDGLTVKYDWPDYPPCWYRNGYTEKQSIEAMKAYDRSHGFKTLFLFELK